ncbi:hypothetical protein, partial [Fluviibacter phosphoraccumulans]|uniref:hypothetical protein n=1 Tax=Fluviibacter phosphoraccumulans TaxID=1751046 RepID=UPI0024E2268C
HVFHPGDLYGAGYLPTLNDRPCVFLKSAMSLIATENRNAPAEAGALYSFELYGFLAVSGRGVPCFSLR